MKKLIVVAGPTASGKTALSIQLAKHFQTEIISADSRQVYRELNIGTAKPTLEQLTEVPHHFINSTSINSDFNAGNFETEAHIAIEKIFETKNCILLTGGSGLYINAVLFGFDALPATDPELRKVIREAYQKHGIIYLQNEIQRLDPVYAFTVDLNNPQRIMRALETCYLTGRPYSSLISKKEKVRDFKFSIYILEVPRQVLYSRINSRVDEMVKHGLFEEATALYPFRHKQALQTVGYKEIFESLETKDTMEITIEKIKKNTRNYAKRQETWFRRIKKAIPVPYEDAFNYIVSRESTNI